MRTAKGINKLNAVIDWEWFRSELESLLGHDVLIHAAAVRLLMRY